MGFTPPPDAGFLSTRSYNADSILRIFMDSFRFLVGGKTRVINKAFPELVIMQAAKTFRDFGVGESTLGASITVPVTICSLDDSLPRLGHPTVPEG